MTDERASRLFEETLRVPEEERVQFLYEECGGDEGLLLQVLRMLEREGQLPPGTGPVQGSSNSARILQMLSARTPRESRYRLKGEIGRGGMGAVLRVWDEDIGRSLAMKVTLGRVPGSGDEETPSIDDKTLGRFLEEAQVTGQLDHPGIVPVHELGIDGDGQVYFTMRLVKGETVSEVLDRMADGDPEWPQTRVLNVLLRACEAMAYAHSKGVIHRDLKPSNLMTGRFGEVYVMDWGIARVRGTTQQRDVRVRPPEVPTQAVHSRMRSAEEAGDRPIVTMDGDILGTPAYMSPEQAAGRIGELGPATDIYALGAILYHVLCGHPPYLPPGSRRHNYAVWSRVQEGPPRSLLEIDPKLPPELVAICERAMARDVESRYENATSLAADLRAFLEGRVVAAFESGALAELRKWIGRNRIAALTIALAALVIMASGFGIAAQEARIANNERESSRELQRHHDERLAAALLGEVDDLWPVHPDSSPRMTAWLDQARDLCTRKDRYDVALERLHERAAARGNSAVRVPRSVLPGYELREWTRRRLVALEGVLDEVSRGPEWTREYLQATERTVGQEVDFLRTELERFDRALERDEVWSLEPSDEEFDDHERLMQLVRNLRQLADPETGAIQVVSSRIERCRSLVRESIRDFAEDWARARESIRQSELYGGLDLPPQVGLVPVGQNPTTRLWEFYLPVSGRPPSNELTGETGIVMVLLPGGEFSMGAQSDPALPNFYAKANNFEKPVHEVSLAPFFISKYEMTQGQWLRAAGSDCSKHWSGTWYGYRPRDGDQVRVRTSRIHPAESMTWFEAVRVLARWGLSLPTEAQWEYAARGARDSATWAGDVASLASQANHADYAWFSRKDVEGGSEVVDGYFVHAPVDAFSPNPFGLFNVQGNVAEWCADWFYVNYRGVEHQARTGLMSLDGHAMPGATRDRAVRGSGFKSPEEQLRASYRVGRLPTSGSDDLGIRPCLAISHEGGS